MQMTMIEALNSALALELERDKQVVLLGQDIGANGGVFRVTEHLQSKFGEDRVFDTPLSESAIIDSQLEWRFMVCGQWRKFNSPVSFFSA